jgi:2-polyprenyl-3-methyl-5-hydroxy-6-metoxy-1,4-benzoquinol methylase
MGVFVRLDIGLSKNIGNLTSSDHCQICGKKMSKWSVKLGRAYYRCPECHFVCIPDGVLMTENGLTIYEDGDAIFMDEGRSEYYLDDTNLKSIRRKLEKVQEYVSQGSSLLDAGANYGHFLSLAKEVYDVWGFDINPSAVTWSQEHFRVRNQVCSIYDFHQKINRTFDVVTCWDTIEHLDNPFLALKNLAEALKLGGYLFISTPDIGSFMARIMGKQWYYINSVEHISLFNRHNLARALSICGFDVVDTLYFGHYYRLRYIVKKIDSNNENGVLKYMGQLGQKLPDQLLNTTLHINLCDVMGMVCIKSKSS